MIRVLIVDDEILARVGIQSLLENSQEIQVVGSFNLASEALEFLKTTIVDIIITDIEMPYMDGLEFIRRIREQNLVQGVIILSCYDKFEYAKQAISLGTDGYILKNSITREALEKEICSVYKKISTRIGEKREISSEKETAVHGGKMAVAIIKTQPKESDNKIITKLLGDIVTHYHMGHLIEAYHEKNSFVVIEFPENTEEDGRKELLEGYIEAIRTNLLQYTNAMPYIGVSGEFDKLQEIPEAYRQAELAMELRFYREKKTVFHAPEICWKEDDVGLMFSRKGFLEEKGMTVFEEELRNYLEQCKKETVLVKTVKETLVQAISIFVYSIERDYFDDQDIARWNSRYSFMETVMEAEFMGELILKLTAMMANFKTDFLKELNEDGFGDVLEYIEKNCASKITIKELADLKNMSLSLFTKKFKNKTENAPVQYINKRKVELVKEYLKKREYTLGEIAELTGFSNENYMVRVFRKVTGKTITEYRKELMMHEK